VTQNKIQAIFLDRDGVVSVEGGEYVTTPEGLQLLPGSPEAIATLTTAGLPIFLFTNQAGVGRGFLTLETLHQIHARMVQKIELTGGRFTALYCCPHAPDAGCDCRKPKAGMLLQAAKEHDLDLARCCVVGDTSRDITAGHSVGCKTVLVLTGHTKSYDPSEFPDPQPDHVFPDLLTAVNTILQL
jgi:histidinol-phosphate phosphatase family protein